jgi:phosphoribosyl 1,2-cyclic phosphate phosphodiesterase
MDYRDKRLRSSIHISQENFSVVIDSGPDFRQQMLRERIGLLDAVVFTHSHKDHIAGLDDVRAYNYKQKTDMPVYGTKMVHDQLKTEFFYAFEELRYPGIPKLQLHEVDRDPFEIKGVKFIPLPVMHHLLPVLGFRINDFAYITDSNFIPYETFQLLTGVQVLVLNSLQREKHISHFNLAEAIAVAQKVGAEKTYFTHISHKLGFHKEVEKELPKGISLGFDGFSFEL